MDNNQTHEVTQEAVKGRFHGRKTITGRTIPKTPDTAERELKRLTNAVMKIANEELRKKLPEIMREYEKAMRGDSRNDGIGDFDNYIRKVFEELAIAIGRQIDSLNIGERIAGISQMAKNLATREWKREVRNTLGIDLISDYYNGGFYIGWPHIHKD